MWISITPELPVRDVGEAQRYYRDVLGFKIGWAQEDGSYGAVYIETLELFLKRCDQPQPGIVCCVRVLDVDSVYASCREAGARIVSPLEEKPWAMREFTLEVPNGHCFRIGQSTLMS